MGVHSWLEIRRSRFKIRYRKIPNLSYVALSEAKIIGTVLCGEDGRRGYLQHLCVVDKFRNRGAGSQLLEAAVEQFKSLGLYEIRIFVFKNNQTGNQYWEDKGWIVRDDIHVRSLNLQSIGLV